MSDVPASQASGSVLEEGPSGKKTIVLVAVDGSEHSFQAFDWYLTNMYKPGSEVLIAYCSDFRDLLWAPVMAADSAAVSSMVQHCEDQTNGIIAQIQERLFKAKVDAKVLRLSGEAGPAIIKAAKEHKVNCIVTGSRGLGTVRRTLLGSVSSYIVHHAHCPVLVCQHKNQ